MLLVPCIFAPNDIDPMPQTQSAKTIAKSVFSNWTGFFVKAIITFFLTPFVLSSLGDTRFGIWALVTSLTGYYGLLNMGVSQSLTYFFSQHLAQDNYKALNKDASTGSVLLTCAGCFLILVSIVLAGFAPRIFSVDADSVSEVQWCLFIMGCSVALQFFFFVYTAVFLAKQRFDLINSISITAKIFYAIGVIFVLSMGWGLIGLVSWAAINNLLANLVFCRVAKRILPELSISFAAFDSKRLKGLFTYGGWSMVASTARRIINQTDVIIIALFMSSAAITPYYLAVRIAGELSGIVVSIGRVFFPFFTQLAAVKDDQRIRRVYLRGTRLVCALTITLGAVSFYWSENFYRIWLGEKYVFDTMVSIPLLYGILVAKAIVALAQLMGNQIFSAKDRLPVLGITSLSEAVANLVLSIVLLQWFGLVGVALGTLIPAIVISGCIQPIVVGKIIDLPMREFFATVLFPVVLLLSSLGLIYFIVPSYHATTWCEMIVGGVVTLIPVATLSAFFLFDSNDRKQFIIDPVNRIISMAKRWKSTA